MSPCRLYEKTHSNPDNESLSGGVGEGGHAEAGEVVNRMEQPSALFSIWYVQEEWLYTFLFQYNM